MQRPTLLPLPPLDSAINPTVQLWVTGFMAVVTVLGVLYGLYSWSRSGRPSFLMLFVAGGMMMLFEALVDAVGACWFPQVNSWVALTLYGRPLPIWLCLVYFVYFGLGISLTWQFIERGVTATQLWTVFVVGAVADFILEAVLLHFDTYIYYANQPLVLLKFPLWWAPVNSLIGLAAASLCYLFDAKLRGWRQLLIIPIALSTSAAVNCAAGWPSWLVINTPLPWFWTQVGGLATFALSIWFMSMLVRFVAVDAPVRGGVSVILAEARAA